MGVDAQARALLCSYWAVYSDATVKLYHDRCPRDGPRSQGRPSRGTMLALIDNGEPHEAHPAFWAQFVVVGEGGAGR